MKVLFTVLFGFGLLTSSFLSADCMKSQCSCVKCECTMESHCGCKMEKKGHCGSDDCPCGENCKCGDQCKCLDCGCKKK